MILHSLYNYHAEWPLTTGPCINTWEPTEERDPSCRCCTQPTSPSCSGPLQWISRSPLGLAPRSDGSPCSAGGSSRTFWIVFRDKEAQTFHCAPTSSFITLTIWNIAPSVCCCSPPAPAPFVRLYPSIAGTPPKVWGYCANLGSNAPAINAHFKIESACTVMLPPSPSNLPLPLYSSHFSHFPRLLPPASHTDKQLLPRDRFHINDYWLLNQRASSVWSMQNSFLVQKLFFLDGGRAWTWGALIWKGRPQIRLSRTYLLEQRRYTTVSGHAMRRRPSKPADRKTNRVNALVQSSCLSNRSVLSASMWHQPYPFTSLIVYVWLTIDHVTKWLTLFQFPQTQMAATPKKHRFSDLTAV